jgi:RNA polymerase sigma-70 factor (ECF subfamily)
MSVQEAIPNDEELVRAAQEGNLDAFTMLYERYLPVVYNRVRYLVPETDVEDVTQEVFIDVVRSLKNFRCESTFHTWLRTLASREIANYYRRRNPTHNVLDMDVSSADDHEIPQLRTVAESLAIDDNILVRTALNHLPERYQEILLLRFADELQFNEIAQVLGQSLEATKSLFRRAIAALQKELEESNG